MSGHEVARRVREQPELRDRPGCADWLGARSRIGRDRLLLESSITSRSHWTLTNWTNCWLSWRDVDSLLMAILGSHLIGARFGRLVSLTSVEYACEEDDPVSARAVASD